MIINRDEETCGLTLKGILIEAIELDESGRCQREENIAKFESSEDALCDLNQKESKLTKLTKYFQSGREKNTKKTLGGER